MAQHDYDVANGSGAVVRADINDVLEAIATGNSGSSAPSVTFAYMRWFDTGNNVLKIRNGANTNWIVALPDITAVNMGLAALATANLFTALQKFSKGSDIASAGTLAIGTDGNFFDVTGTTTITAMTVAAGALFVLQFDGALTLTDGASLELGAGNIVTAAGDHAVFYATAANTVTLLAYRAANSSPVIPSQAEAEAGTATTPRPWTAERVKQAIDALASGKFVALERKTNSSVAAYDFVTGISSTYRTYLLKGWLQPATDDVELWLRVSDDGGSTFEADAGDYSYSSLGNDGGGVNRTKSSTSDVAYKTTTGDASIAVGNASGEKIEFEFLINAPSAAAPTMIKHHIVWLNAGGNHVFNIGGGCSKAAAAVNGFRLLFESGNIATGDVTLYALANS